MSKSTSLVLGILATTISAMMIYGCVRIVLFIQNPNMDFGEGEMAISYAVIVMLGAMFGLVILAGATILFSLGVPHYYLYLKDRHKSAYLYLVKYLSVIPAALLGFWFVIWLFPLFSGGMDPRMWDNLGIASLIGGPFAVLAIFTKDIRHSKKYVKHHE